VKPEVEYTILNKRQPALTGKYTDLQKSTM